MNKKWSGATTISLGGVVIYKRELSPTEMRKLLFPRRSPRKTSGRLPDIPGIEITKPRRKYTKTSTYWKRSKK